jgi:hypothetical protein
LRSTEWRVCCVSRTPSSVSARNSKASTPPTWKATHEKVASSSTMAQNSQAV